MPECRISSSDLPQIPDFIPAELEIDKATGLHMTGDVQLINIETYHLSITGLVEKPLQLTYDQLHCMPTEQAAPALICPGAFIDQAMWSGIPFSYLLALSEVQEDATILRLISADGYSIVVSLSEAVEEGNFLALAVNGEPLPVLHGFPARAVFSNLYGSNWVKWVTEIRVE